MTVSFAEHLTLLDGFLRARQEIAARIEQRLLNVRGKETSRRRDRAHFSALLNDCFFGAPGVPRDAAALKGQLAQAHLEDGFEPVRIDKYAHELDPLELLPRTYEYWEATRWPGSSGRLAAARVIYVVFMLRQLELLSLRVLDAGDGAATEQLDAIQQRLDRLNAPEGERVIVRDAAWLIQTAQGPLTAHLQPYFEIADRIARAFDGAPGLRIHDAGVRLGGGHLRSQLHYRVWSSGKDVDDPELRAFMRFSNSMDMALLVRDLVPVLEAYVAACDTGDADARARLSDTIVQGLSADPELFLTRLDLLTPSTMIETLFVGAAAESPMYTALGETHLASLRRYRAAIVRAAPLLRDDAPRLDPASAGYSPLGITYGFCSDLLANASMALLTGRPAFGLTLEDTFASGGAVDGKLARAQAWTALPRRGAEREHFDCSVDWAAAMFSRVIDALDARIAAGDAPNASSRRSARIVAVDSTSDGTAGHDLAADAIEARDCCFTSSVPRALSGAATAMPAAQLLKDRNEGRFLASVETEGAWFGVSKLLLTLFTAQGRDALLTAVPPPAAEILRLTCPDVRVSFAEAPSSDTPATP